MNETANMNEIQESLGELKRAIEFFDRVQASNQDEKIAAGRDHWDWLEKAARRAASHAQSASSI